MTQPPYQHDPYQQDPYGYAYPYRPPTSGAAVTSLVLGILALLFCWIPFIGVIAWPLLLVGGGLGLGALGPTRRGEADGYGLAVAGVVCSGVALVVCLAYLVPFLLFTAAAAT
ncbi:DUF4190 domain-containing protein [Pseudonocardia sp. CA-107938]|uniref:DUF4190 domain-containing protein n=1 Tax=Pseudonocardia sp. CA-107938 TaxID=3240021 RepID=UPI003D923B92